MSTDIRVAVTRACGGRTETRGMAAVNVLKHGVVPTAAVHVEPRYPYTMLVRSLERMPRASTLSNRGSWNVGM
jgi:hypothetical protein